MKLKIYLFLLLLIGLGSCKKEFLNLSPETDISSATFYKTAQDFDQAIVGAYVSMRAIALKCVAMDEMRSDNTFFTYYSSNRGWERSIEAYAQFIDDSQSFASANSWVDLYQSDYSGISEVNTILGRIEGSAMTDSEKNSVKAEALFLRAFYYFNLVQHWGPVPLMLTQVTSEGAAFQPNSTVDYIYKQIVDDVNNAIQIGLPVSKTFPQSGRATMGAAKMLQAYVYMSKPVREYALAEAALKDITNMNYQLLGNYADVFDPKNKNNRESIFEVQYLEGIGGQESIFAWVMIPKCADATILMGVSGGNIQGGWNVPTQEMINSYENGDKRLSESVAVAEGVEESGLLNVEAVTDIVGYTPKPGKDYLYFVKKYYHPPYSISFNTGDNFPIYRYSGTLLLLAEALVEQDKAGEALPYLNQVRTRAGLPLLQVATKENVANEMRHELAFENHRWTDLIRTGKAIEVLTKKGIEMKRLNPWILPSAFNVTENRLIFPFPYREMQINKLLKQNPGYQ